MLKRELKILLTAIMFYTRIPVPSKTGFSEENLNKATRYFPFIGIIVGGFGAVMFLLASSVVSVNVSVIFSLIMMIMITGAFHEDALSDFCDGFGGGYSKEQILKIMKDSRIGTYGAIGLVMLLLSKFLLLSELSPVRIPLILIASHALSRLNPVFFIFSSKYVSNNETAKSKPVGERSSIVNLVIAVVFGLAPLLFFSIKLFPFFILVQIAVLLYFRYYVHRKIGGYTGDVLGALQQFSEIAFYLTLLIAGRVL
jgi:adenosylcobinamide-GDP ribazoletransferase